MAEEDILSDELLRQLISVGEVDILVGLHTYNDAKTIGHVVQVIREGLLRYFPRERAAILNADGGSADNTPELVQAASISDARQASTLHTLRTLHCISSRYAGHPSAGKAMHTIVAAADLLRAKACAVIAPRSSEIVPEWMDRLLRPIYRDHFDYVTPVYQRHHFEGILVTNLMYPMVRAAYGIPICEPRPGEFGFSDRLAGHLLGEDVWSQDVGRSGPEVIITMSALAGGYRMYQSFLGPKGHVEQQSSDLVHALRQTVAPLFWSLAKDYASWSAVREAQAVPTLGPNFLVTMDSARLDRKRLHHMFCSGVVDLEPVLKSILTPPTLAALQRIAATDEHRFDYSDELWVKAVYEFAASYHKSVISRDHIIQALAPLYRGRVYAFLEQNLNASEQELEHNLEVLCQTFERLKPYLLERWAGQEGSS